MNVKVANLKTFNKVTEIAFATRASSELEFADNYSELSDVESAEIRWTIGPPY